MKTLEKREKVVDRKNNEVVPTKLLISQLPFIINFKTWYLMNANVIFLYSVIYVLAIGFKYACMFMKT